MEKQPSFLSDSELINELNVLAQTDRKITERTVRALAEMEVRKLYAGLGYSSLFDYATRGLGFSPSAAMRRINAARVGVKMPEVLDCLEKQELTLSTVQVLSRVIENSDASRQEQAPSLLEKFRGKSQQQAEEIAALMQPTSKREVRDRIQPVVIAIPDERKDERQSALSFETAKESEQKSIYFRSVVKAEKRYEISFSVGEDFQKKLQRAKQIAFRGAKADVALEKILGDALDEYLMKRCPKEREKRRQVRAERRQRTQEIPTTCRRPSESAERVPSNNLSTAVTANPELQSWPAKESSTLKPSRDPIFKRQIPIPLRDKVLARDNYQCTYVSPAGVKCCADRDLDIDHIWAAAKGGLTIVENLRTRCSTHNNVTAREEFGREFLEARILAKKRIGNGIARVEESCLV